jgi:hypothetical protein
MTELQRLARRLADDYQFECQGGPLRNCMEWRALCAAIDTLAVDTPPSGASPQAETGEAGSDDLPELWRQKVYAHIPPDTFRRLLCDLTNAGWDDTRLEVLALQSIVDSRQPAPVSPVEPEPCVWREVEGSIDTYASSCGAMGAKTIGASKCCFCGAPLKVEREP